MLLNFTSFLNLMKIFKKTIWPSFLKIIQILTIAALVLTYIVQKSKVLLPQLLNGFEPADHPKLAILNVFMYVLNTLALIGNNHFSANKFLNKIFQVSSYLPHKN